MILFVFKRYIKHAFSDSYYLYRPTPEEIANARVHSERADTKQHRLEKRFGHPALHMELFTPMVHAKHAHLLAEVYHGRLGSSETRLREFGGAKMETTVAPGGLKIAGIEQVCGFLHLLDVETDVTCSFSLPERPRVRSCPLSARQRRSRLGCSFDLVKHIYG
jgi:hypothetical protein